MFGCFFFFLLTQYSFGPNTFPANNSALYACEVQVDYAARALVKPIIDRRVDVLEVKEAVESRTTNDIHLRLRDSVFAGKCTNWYIGKFGRNAASWPGMAIEFWLATLFPDHKAFIWEGGNALWRFNAIWRWIQKRQKYLSVSIATATIYWLSKVGLFENLPALGGGVRSLASSL